jgi:hydroxymethylpyrimidine kinase/phosphomethylpyrimidine kinase
MPARKKRPVALTIAGSDSGGGAGVQADLKAFASLGVHGTSAITCITAQNPRAVLAIQPVKDSILTDQICAVFDRLRPAAVKTGMLHSTRLIRRVVDLFMEMDGNVPPLVVDPVMVATSGAMLLKPGAIRTIKAELLPHATLVTPNLNEASLLLNGAVRTIEDATEAARAIYETWGCAALIKGGHRNSREAVDVLFTGDKPRLFSSRFIKGAETHGTGCTLSAAITAHLALGRGVTKAVQLAKGFITAAITNRYRAGDHEHLNQ